jgi:hypothetical protein
MTASKYERTHPVISIRVNQEIWDELQERRRDGQSYGQILRIGLDKQEAAVKSCLQALEDLAAEYGQLEEKVDEYRLRYGDLK